MSQAATREPSAPPGALAGSSRPDAPAPMLVLVPTLVIALGSLLPLGVWWADASAQGYRGAWQTWGWGTLVVALLSVLVVLLSRGRAVSWLMESAQRMGGISSTRFIGAVACLLAVAT